MDVEETLKKAMHDETARARLPQELFAHILRRARIRRILTSSVVASVLAGTVIGLIAGVREIAGVAPSQEVVPRSSSTEVPSSVLVPNIVGLSQEEAIKELAAEGLTAEIEFEPQASPVGDVVRTVPPLGTEVSATSTVVVVIAGEGPPGRDVGPGVEELGWLVEANPEVFVGLYRDRSGVLVVVFNPGVDQAAWRDRLGAAAGDREYRTAECPRSRRELQRIQAELHLRAWSPRAASIGFATFIHPATCSVRLETDQLTSADLRALQERFGAAVTVDATGHPERV